MQILDQMAIAVGHSTRNQNQGVLFVDITLQVSGKTMDEYNSLPCGFDPIGPHNLPHLGPHDLDQQLVSFSSGVVHQNQTAARLCRKSNSCENCKTENSKRMTSKRLQRELADMEKDSLYSVILGEGEDLSHWMVQIPGPV